jgi:ribosomal 50S subunit-associated protein YjgA (DUF615 family)
MPKHLTVSQIPRHRQIRAVNLARLGDRLAQLVGQELARVAVDEQIPSLVVVEIRHMEAF